MTDKTRTEISRSAAAYHEAGHAVAAHAMGLKLHPVTIRSRGGSAGPSIPMDPLRGIRLEFGSPKRTQLQIEAAIIVLLAGSIAQRRHEVQSWSLADREPDRAAGFALALRVSPDPETAAAHLRWLELRAIRLVEERWAAVERVANALLDKRTLTVKEISGLVSASPSGRASRAT
jgi:ATP-dependent Zn protease